MQRSWPAVVTAILLLCAPAGSHAQTDLTGDWSLSASINNVSGPDASVVPGSLSGMLTLTQSGTGLTGTGFINGQSVTLQGGTIGTQTTFVIQGLEFGGFAAVEFHFGTIAVDQIDGQLFGQLQTGTASWDGNFTMVKILPPTGPLAFNSPRDALAHLRGDVARTVAAARQEIRNIVDAAIDAMDDQPTANRFPIRDQALTQIQHAVDTAHQRLEDLRHEFHQFLAEWVLLNPDGGVIAQDAGDEGDRVVETGGTETDDTGNDGGTTVEAGTVVLLVGTLEEAKAARKKELETVRDAALNAVKSATGLSKDARRRIEQSLRNEFDIAIHDMCEEIELANAHMGGAPDETKATEIRDGALDTLEGITHSATATISDRASTLCDLVVEITGVRIETAQAQSDATDPAGAGQPDGVEEYVITVTFNYSTSRPPVTLTSEWKASLVEVNDGPNKRKENIQTLLPTGQSTTDAQGSRVGVKFATEGISGPEFHHSNDSRQVITIEIEVTITGVDAVNCKSSDKVATTFTIYVDKQGRLKAGKGSRPDSEGKVTFNAGSPGLGK